MSIGQTDQENANQAWLDRARLSLMACPQSAKSHIPLVVIDVNIKMTHEQKHTRRI